MDAFYNTIVALSNLSKWQQLQTFLSVQQDVLQTYSEDLFSLLELLSFPNHSLAVLHVLQAIGNLRNSVYDEKLIKQIIKFLNVANGPQISVAPETFRNVCCLLKDLLVKHRKPKAGIKPLLSAINLLNPGPNNATPQHALVLQLCILAKCYNAAEDLLKEDIFGVAARSAIVPSDLLLYFYYAGWICIGRRQYSRALSFLGQGLAVPTTVASAIAVASFKKYMIVSTLLLDDIRPPPVLTKAVQTPEVLEYRRILRTGDAVKFTQLCQKNKKMFVKDNNWGLVRLLIDQAPRTGLRRLATCYCRLSIAEAAKRLCLPSPAAAEHLAFQLASAPDVESRLQSQIQINQEAGALEFPEDPEGGAEDVEVCARLEACMRDCVDMGERLGSVKEKLVTNPTYIRKKMVKGKKTVAGEVPNLYGLVELDSDME